MNFSLLRKTIISASTKITIEMYSNGTQLPNSAGLANIHGFLIKKFESDGAINVMSEYEKWAIFPSKCKGKIG